MILFYKSKTISGGYAMVAYYKKIIEPVGMKELLNKYKWIPVILFILQAWALYRRTESWIVFAAAICFFISGTVTRVYKNKEFLFRLCMFMALFLMFFQWYAKPMNLRADSVRVLSYGENGWEDGYLINDPETVEEIIGYMKSMRVGLPGLVGAYDMTKGLRVKINNTTFELYLFLDDENNHCGLEFFDREEYSLYCLPRYLPGEVNVKLEKLILEWVEKGTNGI